MSSKASSKQVQVPLEWSILVNIAKCRQSGHVVRLVCLVCLAGVLPATVTVLVEALVSRYRYSKFRFRSKVSGSIPPTFSSFRLGMCWKASSKASSKQVQVPLEWSILPNVSNQVITILILAIYCIY